MGLASPGLALARRRRDETWHRDIDAALPTGRNPDLAHGTEGAWKGGCRCPDCRTAHHGPTTTQPPTDTPPPAPPAPTLAGCPRPQLQPDWRLFVACIGTARRREELRTSRHFQPDTEV
ncbi:hypothetical protein [Kitasatospora sp. NPDC057223]|uniref:hypothetical protein n=1 Tax=Kitasatospora sp. NPDC057223 TaxID=3346055 RepID=UPI003632C474